MAHNTTTTDRARCASEYAEDGAHSWSGGALMECEYCGAFRSDADELEPPTRPEPDWQSIRDGARASAAHRIRTYGMPEADPEDYASAALIPTMLRWRSWALRDAAHADHYARRRAIGAVQRDWERRLNWGRLPETAARAAQEAAERMDGANRAAAHATSERLEAILDGADRRTRAILDGRAAGCSVGESIARAGLTRRTGFRLLAQLRERIMREGG